MARSQPTPPLPDSPTFPCHKLRHDLEELYVPKGHDVPDHLRFFPKSCIAKLFTDDRIKEVLECHCSSCQDQKRVFGSRDPDLELVAITGKNLNDHRSRSCAIVLFALLVFIECPSLIYSFLDKRVGDRELESDLVTFTAEYVQLKYWPKQYPRLADKFHWLKFKFFVPCMRDDRYEEYPKGAILPFVNEQRLGRSTEAGEIINEGSFGTVFAFEIVDEYRRFSVSELLATFEETHNQLPLYGRSFQESDASLESSLTQILPTSDSKPSLIILCSLRGCRMITL
jgi:hypothetical protein